MSWTTGVRSTEGEGILSLRHRVQTGSGFHKASYRMDTGSSFLGVKRPGRVADHPPRSCAEVKKVWSYTSIRPYVFKAWCFINRRIRLHGVVVG